MSTVSVKVVTRIRPQNKIESSRHYIYHGFSTRLLAFGGSTCKCRNKSLYLIVLRNTICSFMHL